MWLIVTICLSVTVSEILTSEVSKKMAMFCSLLGILNDLKFVSGVESLSVYYMPKNQISETKKNLIFFVTLVLTFKVIQGQRSWCQIKA